MSKPAKKWKPKGFRSDPINAKIQDRRLQKKKRNDRKEQEETFLKNIEEKYEKLRKTSSNALLKFTDFPLSWRTQDGLKENEYVEPTDIQKSSLPYTLSGSDIVGAAKTGSGKTLALVIPVLESLWRANWCQQYGLGALIISPTRELALQTFSTINAVGKQHEFSCALLIGGSDVEFEKSRIAGVNIIVCTPGRLLQHMDENEQLNCDDLQILVLDEADRILDMGFSKQINSIISNLPRTRQTLLFSATQTRNVKDLCRVCTKDPVFVSTDENATNATPDNLKQSFVVCEDGDKVNTLWSFIVAHKKKKTLVFVSSCKQARFLTQAFCHLRPGLPVMGLWGTMNQKKRFDVFQKFDERKEAVMIATDVASRGLDFDNVDWVIQVDCPATVDDYIHRVGRSARMNKAGNSVLFVTPSQQNAMVKKLETNNIPVEELIIHPNMKVDIRLKLRSCLAESLELKTYAQKSVVAYLRAVFMMQDKKVFNLNEIDAAALADSYGLVSVPRVRFLAKKLSKDKKTKVEKFEINPDESKQPEDSEEDSDGGEEVPKTKSLIGKFSLGDDVAGADDLLVVKKKNVFEVGNAAEKDDQEADDGHEKLTLAKGKPIRKAVTKNSLAKKVLKKKMTLNNKKTFNDDEEPSTSKDSEVVGLDIASAKKAMKEVDKDDRKRYRELKQKRKIEKLEKKAAAKRKAQEADLDMEESDGDGPNLDWLPDPDEVRKRYKAAEENDDEDMDVSNAEAEALRLLSR